MNRLVAIILSVIIFMSLAACGKENNATEASSVKREYATELTDEKRQELQHTMIAYGDYIADYPLGTGNRIMGGYYYYGTYDGYDVFFCTPGIVGAKMLIVEDFEFGYGNGIYAHRNGDIMQLQNAYDNGWITYEDLAAIHQRHLQCKEENYP